MKASRIVTVAALMAGLALSAALPAFAGGWAVVTLDSLPQGVEPGVAFTVGFTVRQHGVTPLSNLDPAPEVTARHVGTSEVVRSNAEDEGASGHYSAHLSLPSAGEWSWGIAAFGAGPQPMPAIVVVDTGSSQPSQAPSATASSAFGILSAILAVVGIGLAWRRRFLLSGLAIVLAAVAAGVSISSDAPSAARAAVAEPVVPEQGEALFIAKGCIVCHVHQQVPASESTSISIGPDLTLYSNDPAFLSRWLADPVAVRPATQMPDLGLSQDEIDALIAFLNGEGDA